MEILKRTIVFAVSVMLCIGAMTGVAYASYSGRTETIKNEIMIKSQRQGHHVTFELNGGTWADGYTPPNSRQYDAELILPTAEKVAKEGYAFGGWYTDAEFSGEAQTECALSQTEDITYYARWRGNAYLMDGMDFNKTVKTLANGTNTGYTTFDYLITGVQWADSVPAGRKTAVVTKETSDCEVVAYFDSDTGMINLVNVDDALVYMDADSSYMFNKFGSLLSVDMSKFISTYVTDIKYIFCDCTALEELSLTTLDTSKVTTLKGIFAYCENLKTLDLSGWNVEKATNLSSMFIQCFALASLNLDGWNPQSATEMASTFSSCSSLTNVDLSGWNTKSLTTTYYMFSACSSLRTVDLSGWNTAKLTTTRRMFDDCTALRTVDLTGWNTSKVTIMANMFQNTYQLREVRMEQYDMSAVTDKGGMMYRAAYSTGNCTIYCTEETEAALLDNTRITSNYFTFIHPESTAALMLSADANVASGSDAKEAESGVASESDAKEAESGVASESDVKEAESEVASGSNAEEADKNVI